MNADWIEREIDHILMIQADVELHPNKNEVSAVKWVNAEELDEMLVNDDPKNVIAMVPLHSGSDDEFGLVGCCW